MKLLQNILSTRYHFQVILEQHRRLKRSGVIFHPSFVNAQMTAHLKQRQEEVSNNIFHPQTDYNDTCAQLQTFIALVSIAVLASNIYNAWGISDKDTVGSHHLLDCGQKMP